MAMEGEGRAMNREAIMRLDSAPKSIHKNEWFKSQQKMAAVDDGRARSDG